MAATSTRNLDLVLRVQDKNAIRTVKDLKSQVTSLTKATTALAGIFTAIASIKFFHSAFKEARQLEEQMKVIQGLAGMSTAEFDLFERKTRQVARGIGSITALDFAKIEKTGVVMGIAKDQLLEFSESIGYGSIALYSFGRDTELLSRHLAKQMKIFGLGAKDVNAMMSSMALLETTTAASALEISEFNQQLAAHARIMKLSQAEASAWGATLIGAGLQASKAARQVRSAYNIFIQHMSADKNNSLDAAVRVIDNAVDGGAKSIERLEQVTGKTIKEMGGLRKAIEESLGISGAKTFKAINISLGNMNDKVTQGQEALKLYGAVGANSMQVLALDAEDLEKRVEGSTKAFDEATKSQEIYETIASSNSEILKVFGSIMNDISLQVGGPILTSFARFTKVALIPLATEFSDWLETSQAVSKVILTLVKTSERLGEMLYGMVHFNKSLSQAYFLFRQLLFLGEDFSTILFRIQKAGYFAFIPFFDSTLNLSIEVVKIFEELDKKVRMAAMSFNPLVSAINGVTAAIDYIAEIGWRRSVFPEFILWIFRLLKKVDLITRHIAWFDRNLKHAAGVLGTLVIWTGKFAAGVVAFIALREVIKDISAALNELIGIDIYAQLAGFSSNLQNAWQPSILSTLFDSIKRWFSQWLDALVEIAEDTLFESFTIGFRAMVYELYDIFSTLPVTIPERILIGWGFLFQYLMGQLGQLKDIFKDSDFSVIIETMSDIAQFQLETLGNYIVGFATVWQKLWQGDIAGALQAALDTITVIIEFAIQQWLIILWATFPKIKAPLMALTGAIADLIQTAAKEFFQFFTTDTPTFESLFVGAEQALTTIVNIMTASITKLSEGITEFYTLVSSILTADLQGILTSAAGLVQVTWETAIVSISTLIKAFFPSLGQYFEDFGLSVSSSFSELVDIVIERFLGMIQKLQASLDFHEIARALKAFFDGFLSTIDLEPLFNALDNVATFLAEVFTRLSLSTQEFQLDGQFLAETLNSIIRVIEGLSQGLVHLAGPVAFIIKSIKFLVRTIITGWGRIFQFVDPKVWGEISKYFTDTVADMVEVFTLSMKTLKDSDATGLEYVWGVITSLAKALSRGKYFIEFFFLDVVLPFLDVLTILTGAGGILKLVQSAGKALDSSGLADALRRLFKVFYDAQGVSRSFRQTGDDVVETVRSMNNKVVNITERTRTAIDSGFDKMRLGLTGTKDEIGVQLTELGPKVKGALEDLIGVSFTDDLSRFGREFEHQYRKVGDEIIEFTRHVESGRERVGKFKNQLAENLKDIFPDNQLFQAYKDDVAALFRNLGDDVRPEKIFEGFEELSEQMRPFLEDVLGGDIAADQLGKLRQAINNTFDDVFDQVNISGTITKKLTSGFDEFTKYTKLEGWEVFFNRLQISLEAIPDVLRGIITMVADIGKKIFPRVSFFQSLSGESQFKEAGESVAGAWEALVERLQKIPSPLELPWKAFKFTIKSIDDGFKGLQKLIKRLKGLSFIEILDEFYLLLSNFIFKKIPQAARWIGKVILWPFKKIKVGFDYGRKVVVESLEKLREIKFTRIREGWERVIRDTDNFLDLYRIQLRTFQTQIRKWREELSGLLDIGTAFEWYGTIIQNVFSAMGNAFVNAGSYDFGAFLEAVPSAISETFADILYPTHWFEGLGKLWEKIIELNDLLIEGIADLINILWGRSLIPDWIDWNTLLGDSLDKLIEHLTPIIEVLQAIDEEIIGWGQTIYNVINTNLKNARSMEDLYNAFIVPFVPTKWLETLTGFWEKLVGINNQLIEGIADLINMLWGHTLIPDWIDWNELLGDSLDKLIEHLTPITEVLQAIDEEIIGWGQTFYNVINTNLKNSKFDPSTLFQSAKEQEIPGIGIVDNVYQGLLQSFSTKKDLSQAMIQQFRSGEFVEGIKTALTLALDLVAGKIQLGASLLDSIIPGVKASAVQMQEILSTTLGSVFENLTSLNFGEIFSSGAGGLGHAVTALSGLSTGLVPIVNSIAETIVSITAGDFTGAITSIGETFTNSFTTVGNFFAELLEQWFPGTSDSVQKLFAGVGKIFKHVSNIILGIVRSLSTYFAPTLDALAEAVDAFAFGDIEGAIRAAWETIRLVGLASVDAISTAIKDLAPQLSEALALENLFNVDEALGDRLSDVLVAAIADVGPKTLDAFENWLETSVMLQSFQDLGNVLLFIWDIIKLIASGWQKLYILVRYFPDALAQIWEWIKRIPLEFSNAWTELKHAHGWIEKIKGILALLFRPLSALGEAFDFLLNKLVMPIITMVTTLVTLGGSGVLTGLWHTLVGIGKTLGTFIIQYAKQKFVELITYLGDIFAELGGQLVQNLLGPVSTAIDAVKAKWIATKEFLGIGEKSSVTEGLIQADTTAAVTQINTLKDQMLAIETLSEDTKTSYLNTFNAMKVAIANNIEPSKELQEEFDQMVTNLNLVADASHGHSTWPDMKRSIMDVYPALGQLQDEFDKTRASLEDVATSSGDYADMTVAGLRRMSLNVTGQDEYLKRYAKHAKLAGVYDADAVEQQKSRTEAIKQATEAVDALEGAQGGTIDGIKAWNKGLRGNRKLLNIIGIENNELKVGLEKIVDGFRRTTIAETALKNITTRINEGENATIVMKEEIGLLEAQFASYAEIVSINQGIMDEATQTHINKLRQQGNLLVTSATLMNQAFKGELPYGYDITNRKEAVLAVKAIANEINNIDFHESRSAVQNYINIVDQHLNKLRQTAGKTEKQVRADIGLAWDMEQEIMAAREQLLEHDAEVFKSHIDAERQWIDALEETTMKWLFKQADMEQAIKSTGIEMNEYTLEALNMAKADFEAAEALDKKVNAVNKLAPSLEKVTEVSKATSTAIQKTSSVIESAADVTEASANQMVQIITSTVNTVEGISDFIAETQQQINQTADASAGTAAGVVDQTSDRVREEMQLFTQLSEQTQTWLIQQQNVEQAFKRAGIAYNQYTLEAFQQFKADKQATDMLNAKKDALESVAQTTQDITGVSAVEEKVTGTTKAVEALTRSYQEPIVSMSPTDRGIQRQGQGEIANLTTALKQLQGTIQQFIGSLRNRGGATSFHSGGLASDEIPAILQTGEYVLSRRHISMMQRDPFLLDWLKNYGVKFHQGGTAKYHEGGGVKHTHDEPFNLIVLDPKAGKGMDEALEKARELREIVEDTHATPMITIDEERGYTLDNAMVTASEYNHFLLDGKTYQEESLNILKEEESLRQRAIHYEQTGQKVTEQSMLAIGHSTGQTLETYQAIETTIKSTDKAATASSHQAVQSNQRVQEAITETADSYRMTHDAMIQMQTEATEQTQISVENLTNLSDRLDQIKYSADATRSSLNDPFFAYDATGSRAIRAGNLQRQADALESIRREGLPTDSSQTLAIREKIEEMISAQNGINYITDTKVVGELIQLRSLLKESLLVDKEALKEQQINTSASLGTIKDLTGIEKGSFIARQARTEIQPGALGGGNTVNVNVNGRDKDDQQLAKMVGEQVEGALNKSARFVQSRVIL